MYRRQTQTGGTFRMAYNYSPAYLLANKDLLQKLINLADTGTQGEAEFSDPGKAQAFQFKVNNLLASLAVNHPGRAYVRRVVRTWVASRGDKTVIVIGVPEPGHILRGAKPVPVEVKPHIMDFELVIQDTITAETWTAISLKLAEAKISEAVRRITIHRPPDPKGIQFIAEGLSPEFQLVTTSPTMVLERVATSQPPVQP